MSEQMCKNNLHKKIIDDDITEKTTTLVYSLHQQYINVIIFKSCKTTISFVCILSFFFFNDPATTEIYPLPLHDAFPISTAAGRRIASLCGQDLRRVTLELGGKSAAMILDDADLGATVERLRLLSLRNSGQVCSRSEEHTSELQSPCNLVCRLLLEKKKHT